MYSQDKLIVARILNSPMDQLCISSVQVEELLHGPIEAIRRLHVSNIAPASPAMGRIIEHYDTLWRIHGDLLRYTYLPFDAHAATRLIGLTSAVGIRDRLIASVALSNGKTVVTKNLKDFVRLMPLDRIEDWSREDRGVSALANLTA
jgi:predicted nucleic acid-binding protein